MQYGSINLKGNGAWEIWLSEEYALVTITHVENYIRPAPCFNGGYRNDVFLENCLNG